MKNVHKILVENLRRKDHSGDLSAENKKMLKEF
jgi:hypothetical protein